MRAKKAILDFILMSKSSQNGPFRLLNLYNRTKIKKMAHVHLNMTLENALPNFRVPGFSDPGNFLTSACRYHTVIIITVGSRKRFKKDVNELGPY